jgi:predicted O-linked N-acetylglucosamine transferase (SPINDLY family)
VKAKKPSAKQQALFQQARSLHHQGQLLAAVAHFQRLLKDFPKEPQLLAELGTIAVELGNFEQGLVLLDKSLRICPNDADVLFNRGVALLNLKRLDAALVSYQQAITLKPDYFYAYYDLGSALQYLGRFADALKCYDCIIALQANESRAYFNRGQVLHELKHYASALADYDRALALTPDYPYLYGQRLFTKRQICDWRGSEQELAELSLKIHNKQPVATPFTVLAVADDPDLQRKAARLWVADKYPQTQANTQISKYPQHARIRIGYFSADFRHHALAFLTAELFETHDRQRFEIVAFSYGPDTQDQMRQRLDVGFDRFIDVQHLADAEVVGLARSLEIDIAVDLGGHTGDSRTGIFALRAASIQVSYLGFLGTMGAEYIDYLLADEVIIPPAARCHYDEKIVYLPSYQVNDSKRLIAEKVFSRVELGLPEQGFVFCCFNHNYKITAETFACWMRILQRVENSVLLLLADNPLAEQNLTAAAVSLDVAADRLIFGQRLPAPEYLARYRTADLFLDTLPYNAGTTASDALWAGLPVLTCRGQTFAGRLAASLLTAIGLPELIVDTPAEFEALAVELACHAHKLAELKDRLRQNRLTTALFDTVQFTAQLEAAYILMYQHYQTGLAVADIEVSAMCR